MQKDLDAYLRSYNTSLRSYNTSRPHQGRNINGKTPEAVFKSGLPMPKKSKEEKTEKPRKISPIQGDNC